MDLFAQEEQEIRNKKKKYNINKTTILLIFIIILAILAIMIYCLLIYVEGTILTITLDGQVNNNLKQMFIVENNNIIVPIKALAPYLNYEAYSGNYETMQEDSSKSYVKSSNEVTMFTANSKQIKQIMLQDNSTREITIDEEIIENNGEFYTTLDGAAKIFSSYIGYNEKENDIEIITLENLYTQYSKYYVSKYGYTEIVDQSFKNKKALLEDMMIIKTDNSYYGVIDMNTEKMILETKYENIEYINELSSFLVTANGVKGIFNKDKSTVLNIEYKDIKIIQTNQVYYYLVTASNNLMGLMDKEGKIILYPEYNKIGIDINNFKNNDVDNEYIIFNKVIPVKRNNLWALFNIEGEQITEFKYTNLGCITKLENTYSVLQIPEFELIIACSESGKYNLIETDGKELFNETIFDSVYKEVKAGKNYYYATVGENTVELVSYLEQNGIERIN